MFDLEAEVEGDDEEEGVKSRILTKGEGGGAAEGVLLRLLRRGAAAAAAAESRAADAAAATWDAKVWLLRTCTRPTLNHPLLLLLGIIRASICWLIENKHSTTRLTLCSDEPSPQVCPYDHSP